MANVLAQSLYRLHYTKNLDLNTKMLEDQVLLLVRLPMLITQLVMDITLLRQEMLLDPPKLFLFYLSPTNQILVMALTHTGNILNIIFNNKYLIT